MKTLRESIKINVSPEIIWEWFLHLAENYCKWHPSHIKAYWKSGIPNKIGSVFYAEEYIAGELLKMKSKLTKLITNRLYKFKTKGSLKLLLPRGSFEINPADNGSIFTATLDFRMGNLLSKIAKKKMREITQHMIEEGQNLKTLLET